MSVIEFPLILAGPIVRRVAPEQIFLWIATSRSVTIDSELYKIEASSGSQSTSFIYQHLDTLCEPIEMRIGRQLFIYLIKVTPTKQSFPTETLIGYNLRLAEGNMQHDLKSLELLNPEHPDSIVYAPLQYPTFMIKSSTSTSHIFYGSCRKPHGDGEDTLALADTILEKHFADISSRPDSLFLMGDQIYADDVADPLFPVIHAISESLIGIREPLYLLEKPLEREPFLSALHQVNGRQYIMNSFCQFTSSHASNHLIELGEYAAMYLLSWSPAIWNVAQANHLFYSFEDLEEMNSVYFSFTDEEQHRSEHVIERDKLADRFTEQLDAIISFNDSLRHVRRLLANIPTYMIFDDHDLTDDWNISAEWKKNVANAPLGRHVIGNGLSAYWAFQGWGNDPASFNHPFVNQMQAYFNSQWAGNYDVMTYYQWLNLLWEFDSWHFVAPTSPNAVFLDTRTQRDYSTEPVPVKIGQIIKESVDCPQLLSNHGWSIVTNKLLSSSWVPNTPLLVISATPVYGMGLIESFLHDMVYPFQVMGVDVQTSFDFEAWKYNGKGFTELLTQVANWDPSLCIFLSGDVHYASAVKATVTFADGRKLPIQQFTSSPLKNMSFSGVWGLLMKGVISVNSIKRKNKDIHRICEPDYQITRVREAETHKPFIWKDQLRYQFLDKGSIIETKNNLGLVSFSQDSVTNKLLKIRPVENEKE